MERSSSGLPDETSEYGSDFTLDEEEILNGFLQEPPRFGVADNPIRDLESQLEDAEDDGGLHGVKLPRCSPYASYASDRRLGTEVGSQQPSTQVNKLTDVSTNGKCPVLCHCGH